MLTCNKEMNQHMCTASPRSKEDLAHMCTKNRERLTKRAEEMKQKWIQSIKVLEKVREAEIIAYKNINKSIPKDDEQCIIIV